MTIVYLNGEYLPLEQAKVSVEDRGFIFGDGIYEVLRYYGGRPFHLDAHLSRLQHSAQASRLPLSPAAANLPEIMERLLVENNLQDTNIYIECTRGASHPRVHAFPAQTSPTLLVMPQPFYALPPGAREHGVPAITVPDLRWGRCDIKSIMLLPNVMAKTEAHDAGVFEAILVRDGIVTEGSSCNIVAVLDGTLATHPADYKILGGVTRDVVLGLARDLRMKVRESAFTRDEMYGAEEVFLTTTTAEVLSISQIDGRTIGAGESGPVAQRLYQAFCKCHV